LKTEAFVRRAWYVAAWSDDVGPTPFGRRICNEPVVFFRDTSGQVHALADYCCHRGFPLSAGQVVGDELQCGYHGLTFRGDGACTAIPGQNSVPARARVRAYPTVEKDAMVWIWMDEPELADATKIVDHPYHTDPVAWPHRHATIEIKCAAQLLVDNLMDLTHLGYVHVKTIGGDPQAQVAANLETRAREDGLAFTRWLLDSATPPTHLVAVPKLGDRIDRWQEFDYSAPACIRQWSGSMPAGLGAYPDGRTNEYFSVQIFHGITPETADTTFYFWSVAIGFGQDDPTNIERVAAEVARTFNEDKDALELQHARISEIDAAKLVNIVSDGTRVQMLRVFERMLETGV
jgi:phenylpropionate dioxygenase-like ring-hydroxylating dioxygenase large terminal subunit